MKLAPGLYELLTTPTIFVSNHSPALTFWEREATAVEPLVAFGELTERPRPDASYPNDG